MARTLIVALVLFPTCLVAQWTADPGTYVTVVDINGTQNSAHSVSDGAGGVITVWQDTRNGSSNRDTYGQRVDASGDVLWATNGVAIGSGIGHQDRPRCVADGEGGVLVAWFDDRVGNDSVYAQRVDADGNAMWIPNGVELFASSDSGNFLDIVSDGSAGAYVAWMQGVVVYAQRVDSNGLVSWPTPTILCDAPNAKAEMVGLADGVGGATFGWKDGRIIGNPKVYAQNVQPSGAVSWIDDGVVLAQAGVDQRSLAIASDGFGGYLFAWQDYRDVFSEGVNLYAQRLLASGAIAWGSGGKAVCRAPLNQGRPFMSSSPGGGAIVTWSDLRLGGSGPEQIYIQRIDVDGDPLWPIDGIRLAPTNHIQRNPLMVPDGFGGAHIAWEAEFDAYVRSIDALGNPGGSGGELIMAQAQGDYTETLVETSDGGAILTTTAANDDLFCDKIVSSALMFIRGDSNVDGTVDIADAQYLLNHLFTVPLTPDPLCLASTDANADGSVDVSDVIYLLEYLFMMSFAPPAPFPGCGGDAATPLACDSFAACP